MNAKSTQPRSFMMLAFATSIALGSVSTANAQRAYKADFSIMPVSSSIKRAAGSTSGAMVSETFSLIGIEASVFMPGGGLGISGRAYSGKSSLNVDFHKYDGILMLGDRDFRLEAGYSKRTFIPVDSTLSLLRAGFGTNISLGTSGVALKFRAGYMLPIKQPEGKANRINGWEGETAASYTWDRFPVSGMVGYRMERLAGFGLDEQMSSLFIGAGLWFWGR